MRSRTSNAFLNIFSQKNITARIQLLNLLEAGWRKLREFAALIGRIEFLCLHSRHLANSEVNRSLSFYSSTLSSSSDSFFSSFSFILYFVPFSYIDACMHVSMYIGINTMHVNM